jgi:hypothetical protein
MFITNQAVQVINHSEPSCNGYFGVINRIEVTGRSTFYHVLLDVGYNKVCVCTEDELMEG